MSWPVVLTMTFLIGFAVLGLRACDAVCADVGRTAITQGCAQ